MAGMSESSTHQLVGYVTKMFPTFGYINNEIFFQKKCVIGPMVEVGDNVATSAVYQPNMPIKWSAEKVWKVQDSSKPRSKDELEEKKSWVDKTRRSKTPEDRDSRKSLHGHEVRPHSQLDRKRPGVSPPRRSGSRGRISAERTDAKRKRLSPAPSNHSRGSPRRIDGILQRGSSTNSLLNCKQQIVPDAHSRFPSLLCPVDLYRIICHWQDSFTLLKPFCPERSTVFQILGRTDDSCPPVARHKAESGFYVNVLLFSMPSMPTLHDKTTTRAESSDREKVPLRKYIKVLTLCKTGERPKAIGGPWNPDLDGPDPLCNSQSLINTAIRICKEYVGLDLSRCTQWHRFLEFRYSRTEGSTARPNSVLFPGSQLWGRSFTDASNCKPVGPSKPYHRIVVYFVPDVWSLMPSTHDWATVKKATECALSQNVPRNFPLTQAEINEFSSTSATTDNDSKSPQPNQVSNPELHSIGDNSAADASKSPTVSKSDETTSEMDKNNMDNGVAGLPSATNPASTPEVAVPEKTPLKSHDEMNLSAMKVSELREQLKVRNLPSDGIKAQLLSRLKTAVEKEAEQAKKDEEERVRKEKEIQDAIAAKEEEDKKLQLLKSSEESAAQKSNSNVSLRNYPSIILQHRLSDEYSLQTVSLDSILESKLDFMDARSYELMICIHNIFDMLRRDAIFTLFRALVTAGDRGIQAKPLPHNSPEASSNSKASRSDHKDQQVQKEPVKLQTIDLPLLCACTFLDAHNKGYFYTDEAEEMIISLGLPVSRYQMRSLITKVADGRRIYYRSLTDAEVSPTSLKNTSPLSEIDDDEYLFELIRGGDAILDEQKELAMPSGSIMVVHTDGTVESGETAPTEAIAKQLAQITAETVKLRRQLKCKTDEVERLRIMTDQIPKLKDKITSSNNSLEEMRRRLRGEHDRMQSAYRLIEQQLNCLDSSRNVLRQAANRLRGRESNSSTSKKPTAEAKENKREQADRKEGEKSAPPSDAISNDAPKVESDTTVVGDHAEKVDDAKPDGEDTSNAMDVSVPLNDAQMVNGIGEAVKEEDTAAESVKSSDVNPSVNDAE